MLSFAAVLALAVSARASGTGPRAWLVPWDLAPARAAGSCFSQVNPFCFAFDGRNEPVLVGAQALREALEAKAGGAKIVPVVVNDVQDRSAGGGSQKNVALLDSILGDESLVDRHVDALMSRVWSDDFDGLELDYERIPAPLYPRFAELVEKLAARLHAKGKILSVDLEVGPFLKAGGPGRTYFPRLARAADQLNMMMYYERGEFSDAPGPGSSLAWFADTAKRLAAALPPAKLTLVASLSGTDWEVPYPRNPARRRVKRLHYGQVVELMRQVGAQPQWSRQWQSPCFGYERDGQLHQVFFEDERSLAEKLAAARAVGASFGLWYLGRVHPDLNSSGLCPR